MDSGQCTGLCRKQDFDTGLSSGSPMKYPSQVNHERGVESLMPDPSGSTSDPTHDVEPPSCGVSGGGLSSSVSAPAHDSTTSVALAASLSLCHAASRSPNVSHFDDPDQWCHEEDDSHIAGLLDDKHCFEFPPVTPFAGLPSHHVIPSEESYEGISSNPISCLNAGEVSRVSLGSCNPSQPYTRPEGAPCKPPQSSSQLFVRRRGELAKVTPSSQGVHPTHTHMFWAGVHYCARCGVWGMTKVVKLAEPCRGSPARAGSDALKRIHKGLPPTPRTQLTAGVTMRPLLVSEAK